MKMLLLYMTIALLTLSFNSHAGKARCKTYLTKLQKVQAQQRQGHSLKKAKKLKVKEDKARDLWWRCENNKLKRGVKKKRK